MKNRVYIASYGSTLLKNENEQITINRNNRKIMKYARRSGRMFLQALQFALENFSVEEIDEYKKGLFVADFLDLTMDEQHLDEVLESVHEKNNTFSTKDAVDFIINNWSMIEAVKGISNIPAFLGAQLTNTRGIASTDLNACSGGMISLKDGFAHIARGDLDIAIVGGTTAKLNKVEKMNFKEMGLFQQGDFQLADGAAVLILESEEHCRARGGIPLGVIEEVNTSFSPRTYLKKEPDVKSLEYLFQSVKEKDVIYSYVSGAFSKEYMSVEKEIVQNVFGKVHFMDTYKELNYYTFAASGLFEIINVLQNKKEKEQVLVSSLGLNGQNVLVKMHT